MGTRIKAGNSLTGEVKTLEFPADWTVSEDSDGHVTASSAGAIPVTPEMFGAAGDGVTDDTTAVQAAIDSGKNVRLKFGKTYLCRRPLTMTTAYQIFDGNGASLKRAAQVVTTTTTAITSGVTNAITVASATSFRVGDRIVVEQSDVFDTAVRTIASIAGNVITISGTFGVTLSGTINVRTAYTQLAVGGNNSQVINTVFDGNSSNWSWGRWEHVIGLYLVGPGNSGLMALRNKLINQPGDAIAVINTTDTRIAYNTITDCKGRGISLGGNSVGARVLYNRIYNCETDATVYRSHTYGTDGANDGHGCVQLSNPVSDLLVHGNRLESGIEGIGSISSSDNSDVTISNNEIRSMSSYAIDAVTGVGHPVYDVLISGNRIYNCGAVQIAMSGSTAVPGNARFTVEGNLLYETPLLVQCSYQVVIRGNQCYSAGTSLTLIRLSNGGGTVGCTDATIEGNVLTGGNEGIVIDSLCSGIAVVGNRIYNQVTDSIITGASGSDILIADNVIAVGAAATVNTNGIVIAGQHEVRNNVVNMGTTVNIGNTAIRVTGTAVKARVIGNTCTVRAATASIQVNASAADTELRDNTCNAVYTDSGTRTVKRGNRINPTNPINGRATLVAGTVTVNTAEVLTGDSIILTNVLAGGTLGTLSVGTISNKASFVINSSSGTDTSTVYWEIVH